MRIGIVAPPWIPVPPPAYGGTEEFVDLLARGLQDAGHEVLLAASSDSTCPVPKVPGTAESDSTAISQAVSEAAHVVRAYGAMSGCELIIDNTTFGPLYGGRPARTPVAWINHGQLTPDALEIFSAGVTLDPLVHLVSISERQAELSVGVPVRAVILHGLKTSEIPVGAGEGGYLAFLGRINPAKGVVEAIEIARAAGMPLKIVAKMREPAERHYFRTEVEPLLGEGVEFLGELERAEKLAFLGSAAALVLPLQWEEPFGLVMTEALAAGTPVLAIPRGAAPEIVRHGVTGFLGTQDELAEYCRRIGELDRARCRQDAEERFDSARMVADYIALFEELAGAGQPRRLRASGAN